jgi:hypothetical protein
MPLMLLGWGSNGAHLCVHLRDISSAGESLFTWTLVLWSFAGYVRRPYPIHVYMLGDCKQLPVRRDESDHLVSSALILFTSSGSWSPIWVFFFLLLLMCALSIMRSAVKSRYLLEVARG